MYQYSAVMFRWRRPGDPEYQGSPKAIKCVPDQTPCAVFLVLCIAVMEMQAVRYGCSLSP